MDTIARIGGDEFAIILSEIVEIKQVIAAVQKVIDSFVRLFEVDDTQLRIDVSVGISLFPQDSLKLEELIHFADQAMYRAKCSSEEKYVFHQKNAS